MQVFIETIETKESRWIDARFDLSNPKAGQELYEQEHIEGAVHWDLERDLSDMAAGTGGRHPLPPREAITDLLQRSGLNKSDHIVIYDGGGEPFAARAWWILKYAGFERVYISRLGFDALKSAGIAVTDEVPSFSRTTVEPSFDDSIHADQETVRRVVNGEEFGVLLDARSAERYAGFSEPIDKVAGRIPGAHNYDWTQAVENGRFLNDIDLTTVVNDTEPTIVYCGSGVTAAALYAVLAESGHEQLRLYSGSFSDWIESEENIVEFDRPTEQSVDGQAKEILAKLIQEGHSGEMLMKKYEYEKSLLEKK